MSDLREEIQCDIAAAFPEHFQNAAEGEDYATAKKLEKLAQSNISKVLDAAIEAAMAACGNSDGSMYDWQVREALEALKEAK